mmetsp:Transcript_19454/g.9048  ORF Transcript_19454/g.9048 Transcript_19454/m.9048 type:complete len:99 (-) Transcript_19454:76-372(-)
MVYGLIATVEVGYLFYKFKHNQISSNEFIRLSGIKIASTVVGGLGAVVGTGIGVAIGTAICPGIGSWIGGILGGMVFGTAAALKTESWGNRAFSCKET